VAEIGTAITVVYAPDAESERVAVASLEATAQAFPSAAWRRIAAFDDASPALLLRAQALGYVLAASLDGEPPRMGRLLEAALSVARGRYVATVEHDVMVARDQVEEAVRVMDRLPNRVGCLYLQSVGPDGRPNYPWAVDWPRAEASPFGSSFRRPRWATLSTTLWRRAALLDVDWSSVPSLEFVDGYLSDMAARAGYMPLMTDQVRAVHLPHTGRRSLGGRARTLSIGCRNIWGRRGIRFSWNEADDDADVHGPILWALPFDSDSFREIYIEGALDGVSPKAWDMVCAEAWRVLKDGCRLAIYGRRLQPLRRPAGGWREDAALRPGELRARAVKRTCRASLVLD